MDPAEARDAAEAPRPFSLPRYLLFFFVVTVFILLLFEGCAAVMLSHVFYPASPWKGAEHITLDHDLGWTLNPYVENHVVKYAEEIDATYRTNAKFRIDAQGDLGVADSDVILIGDSHMFGFGLTDDQTLAAQLHRRLSTEQQPRNVLSAGVPGYGPGQYYLRLRSLGRLPKNALVVVYINPLNDLVDLSTDIDYGCAKPHADRVRGQLKFTKPLLYDSELVVHFGPQYHRLNQVFEYSPAEPPLSAKLNRRSRTVRLVNCLKQGTVRNRWTMLEPVENIGVERTSEEFQKLQLRRQRKDPLYRGSRFWPLITEFEPERQAVEDTLAAVLTAMKDRVELYGARMLVVVAPECYVNQPYWTHRLTVLMEQFPDYTFEWTRAEKTVEQAGKAAGVPMLLVEYAQENIDSMYVPNDGHTSAAAFTIIADDIAKWMGVNGFESS
jgi:hypothetical protein